MAERCLVAASATGLFKHPKIETSGFATWTEDHIAAYRLRWPLGTMERLAIEIGLNHGPRRGDAVLHGPRQEIDGGLGYVQGKTRAEMFNTIWPPLRAAIDAMPVRGLDTYLVTSFGKSFTAAGFGNWFRDACDAVPGLPRALSFHGLRKAVCRRVAEAKGDALYEARSGRERPHHLEDGRAIHRSGEQEALAARGRTSRLRDLRRTAANVRLTHAGTGFTHAPWTPCK